MKSLPLILAAAVVAVSCGDHPVPEHGRITGAHYTPAGVTVIPGTGPMCSGNPPICTPGMPMQIIPYPEEWHLEVTDLGNPKWVGTVEVSQAVYNRCNLNELWPECSQEGSGDAR